MGSLFVVDGEKAEPAVTTSLPAADLRERDHLQQWVIANPSILGEDVLIVCEEYDRWVADIDGAPTHDRLDLLGIDKVGRLAVVELKRGAATRDIHLQALTYAALVSRFDLDTLAQAHGDFLRRRGRPEVSEAEARELLLSHVEGELDPAILRRPRQILIASSFPKQVTHTAVYLSEQGLDISLIQVSLWEVAGRHVAEFSTLYPTTVEEEFTLTPGREAAEVVSKRIQQRTRNRNVVHVLVDTGIPARGSRLRVEPAHGTTADIRQQIDAWLDEDDERRWATWTGDRAKAVRWHADQVGYSPTGLADHLFEEVTGRAASGIQGTVWFVLDHEECPDDGDPEVWADLQGKNLVEIAKKVGSDTPPDRRASLIDRLLAAEVPAEGQELTVVVPRVGLDLPKIRAWLADDPRRAAVRWRADRDEPVTWSYDQQSWGLKDLVREIVRRSTGVETDRVWWPRWFAVADGRALNKVADDAT